MASKPKAPAAPPPRNRAPAAPPPRNARAPAPQPQRNVRAPVAQAQSPRSPQRNQVANTQEAQLPSADLFEEMEADGGIGLSSDAADNIVPFIYILQPLSPQVLPNNDALIPGAEPGHIWLRGSDEPLSSEIWFQPSHFYKDIVEWVPRKSGGGLVARYAWKGSVPDSVPGAKEYRDPERPQVLRWKSKAGNDLVETRYYGGHVLYPDDEARSAEQYFIALSSTGHTFGKTLMTTMNKRRSPRGNKVPIFSSMYLLGTVGKSNNAGEWYSFELKDTAWVTDRIQYEEGRILQQQFESGDRVAEELAETSDGLSGGGSDNNDGGGNNSRM